MLRLLNLLNPLALVAVIVFAVAKVWPTPPAPPAPAEQQRQAPRVIRADGAGDVEPGEALGPQTRLQIERRAKLDALRNVIEKIRLLPLSNGHLVGDSLESSELIALGTGFKLVDTKYYRDGGVEVSVEVKVADIDALVAPAHVVDTIW